MDSGDQWQPAFPNRIATGDPEIDQRFAVFSPAPPERVRAILQNPRLRGALFACSYLDLRVVPEGIVFSDPMQSNTMAAAGGYKAAAAITVVAGKAYEYGLPVHERVADIFLGLSSLAR